MRDRDRHADGQKEREEKKETRKKGEIYHVEKGYKRNIKNTSFLEETSAESTCTRLKSRKLRTFTTQSLRHALNIECSVYAEHTLIFANWIIVSK